MGKRGIFRRIAPAVMSGLFALTLVLGACGIRRGTADAKAADEQTGAGTADSGSAEKEVSEEICGMDISSYISIQQAYDQMNADKYKGRSDYGFKDFYGNIIKDQTFFDFLADRV